MIIDGHSHLTLPIEEHIKTMDRAGVDKTVLFSTSFHPELDKNAQEVKASMHYLNDLLAGKKGNMTEIRKKSIEELVKAINLYPNRYIGFGAVPPGLDLTTTRQYIADNIQKNHLAGMGEFTLGSGQIYLLENIFKSSNEFGNIPIWVHAFFPLTLQDIKEISNLASKYPFTPVILGHLGGINWLETMDIVKETSNLFLDTSAYYSTFVLETVINELPEKCIFGVDRPFGDLQLSKETILKVAESQSIAKAVLGENMAQLLKI
ncbi:amidohydrolase family protein [Clostridium luticellarii]|jgi:predicted TIM-barrel fold metal-dependent hydrolase|uniref:Amidohydrolase n=1 Tax=Clostridium luticellarii TaxID=1691940 RepID=A0A2T0BNC2_9CLOT|nr:amidohydrolase family protein [Clostridium luticellarii]MCI1945429.1 amidohydrolase family protein [Clostridium luticellarii]MCI1968762.1 amidohydrolase family protein [Clostridium luticellarii]MCI1994964.1 amidohydrolase family protein [Clostridium luticellarii]MCI2040189.1 amidohydrolase family protein [Clostridium luticellarii]PRR85353.1 Amidohydrolase [Clostridium luticellarii]